MFSKSDIQTSLKLYLNFLISAPPSEGVGNYYTVPGNNIAYKDTAWVKTNVYVVKFMKN